MTSSKLVTLLPDRLSRASEHFEDLEEDFSAVLREIKSNLVALQKSYGGEASLRVSTACRSFVAHRTAKFDYQIYGEAHGVRSQNGKAGLNRISIETNAFVQLEQMEAEIEMLHLFFALE